MRQTEHIRRFHDRAEAGRELASLLEPLRASNPVVLGLPRGGVPVAAEIARALRAPLDVIVVRKLVVPSERRLVAGAVGEDGVCVLDQDVLIRAGVTADEMKRVAMRERGEVARRIRLLRGCQPRVAVAGRTVIVADDGVATGATARAALQVARARGAARLVLAIPVAAAHALAAISADADEVVCLETESPFSEIREWYHDFPKTTDDDVKALLAAAAAGQGSEAPAFDADVRIPIGTVDLVGHLVVPEEARGIVVFAHGSGSSRLSPRNEFVAHFLNEAGFATLLFDLLTLREERDRANVFAVEGLAVRLAAATTWVQSRAETASLPIGYFGASTGAAAALIAAADPRSPVGAIVSRGGRPDLAAGRLAGVRAPVLLIVGGNDETVLRWNRDAARELTNTGALEVVPGATHLFEEPGALETVAELARRWFSKYLDGSAPPNVAAAARPHP
jgi:predicted phosphoribosyltransferase/predicted alpha/beta-hydrolase family hydrolase